MRFRSLAIASVLASAAIAHAGNITLDFNPANITSSNNNVMDARYRLSQTNWDQIIASSTSISTTTIVQQAGLGNNAALNGVTWDFSIDYSPSNGWQFSLSRPNQTSALVWTASTANQPAFDRSYNALQLSSVIQSLPSSLISASVNFTQTQFTSAGNTVVGTLGDISAAGAPGSNDSEHKWIVADFDLSTAAWSLTGQLQGSFDPNSFTGNLDERVKFDVVASTVTTVPTPGAAAALGLAGLVGLRRRR